MCNVSKIISYEEINRNQIQNTTKRVELQASEFRDPEKAQIMKISKQNERYVEVTLMERKVAPAVKKISKHEYVVLATGEIKVFDLTKNKVKTNENLKKTFTSLRKAIRSNFSSGTHDQLFVTLTYKENMQDSERLYKDFVKFWKRLQYRFKERELGYIAVAEPQGRGAWHMHICLKAMDGNVLFIENKELTSIWGHGSCDAQRLKSDEVGAYYVAYFTDILDESGNKKKNARLHFYPKDFRFFRQSRNMKKPEETKLDKTREEPVDFVEEIKNATKGMKKIYEVSSQLVEVDGDKSRVINQFNKIIYKK